ncbi:MAG: rhodanese-like domain-containing protein [Thermodesulfobacteriota bacterium]
MKQAIWQIPAILAFSVVLGLGVNHFRDGGIPLVRQANQQSATPSAAGDRSDISINRAARLHQEDAAVFIDARAESEYRAGHIKAALNVPWHKAEEMFVEIAPDIPREKPVITYCDGASCNSSDKLAEFLTDLGFEQVFVLPNGWSRWQEKGLPTASS